MTKPTSHLKPARLPVCLLARLLTRLPTQPTQSRDYSHTGHIYSIYRHT